MNMDTTWLKSAQENFRDAVDNKDWDMAKAVVDDLRDRGFTDESDLFGRFLLGLIPPASHGYILGFLRKKNEEYKAKGLVPTLDMLIEDLTG